MSDAVRYVLKVCSLGVPLKVSIDKYAEEWKVSTCFKTSGLEKALWSFLYDQSQSQPDDLELHHHEGEMVWVAIYFAWTVTGFSLPSIWEKLDFFYSNWTFERSFCLEDPSWKECSII